jgi:ATP-binding cassette, subfamily F, member 3
VLLLDEPTNHLDIESIDWVEQYLKEYDGTVVIVSHDRYFLDRMVNHISEIAHSVITDYSGNYEYYLEQRQERRALQQSAHDNQQRQIVETERFIERFRYKASKAKQVQSRIKLLEKLERIPPPPADEASIGFRFPEPPKSGRTVLELSQVLENVSV